MWQNNDYENKQGFIPEVFFTNDCLTGEDVVKSTRVLGDLDGVFQDKEAYGKMNKRTGRFIMSAVTSPVFGEYPPVACSWGLRHFIPVRSGRSILWRKDISIPTAIGQSFIGGWKVKASWSWWMNEGMYGLNECFREVFITSRGK